MSTLIACGPTAAQCGAAQPTARRRGDQGAATGGCGRPLAAPQACSMHKFCQERRERENKHSRYRKETGALFPLVVG